MMVIIVLVLAQLSSEVISMAQLNFNFFKKLPAHEKKVTASTMLTLVRIALVPFIVGAMVVQGWGTAFTLFFIAAITDVLDGNLARWMNEKTFLGACLDPLADKLLVVSCFLTLAFVQSPLFLIPRWFVFVVLCKELLQIAGAIALYNIKGHIEVQPTILGKLTTMVQISFIAWLFACYFFAWLPIKTYYCMLGVVLLLVVASFVQYARIGIAQLKNG